MTGEPDDALASLPVRSFGPYPGTVERIVDGDTVYARLDLGFDLAVHARVRLAGINAPERGTPAGRDAKAYLQGVLQLGDPVIVVSHGWDKYGGRIDGTVLLDDGRDLAAEMLAAGHATLDQRGPRG